jgi:predicted ferric reductase
MKAIRRAYLGIVIGLTILWLLADSTLLSNTEFFAIRASVINLSGILAIGTMCIAMVLAIRPVRLEPLLGGLDKAYRLHRWLGITGLVFAVLHFLLANIPKLMVGAGWLEEPTPRQLTERSNAILQFFQDQRGLAEECGDWGFKIAALLLVIALVKRIPYRFFTTTHRLLSLVFLFLVFHSLALMDFSYWNHAIGPVMVVLAACGGVAAVVSLIGRVGYSRRAVGEIERLHYHTDNSVLKVEIRLKGRWAGHYEGQFAFVTFDRSEGAHPFTIASAWKDDGLVGFFVKGLGDYTKTLPDTLQEGDLVTVEGPYGRFDFDHRKPRQIWVAGGIGIAPFVARIKALTDTPDQKTIDLFYSAGDPEDADFLDRLRSASAEANVRLHVVVPKKDGRLTSDQICQMVPEWRDAAFWFCGPAAFGQSLRDDLVQKGLSSNEFHQELFEMR